MQSILLLLGPALFAASIYMILGRLIVLLDADHLSLIRTKWLTKVFVLGDVLSFLAQSGGGGMLASAKSKDKVEMGENMIVGGLLIQIVFFGFFMVVTVVFHIQIHSQPTSRSLILNTPWEKLILILYASSLFILVRSIFRVAEYVLGKDGALQAEEYWLYIFDATLMSFVAVLFNLFHPSRVTDNPEAGKPGYTVDGYPLHNV